MSSENPYQTPGTEPPAAAGPILCPDCGNTMETGFVAGRARWLGDDARGWAKLSPKELLTPAISLSLTELKAPGHHCPRCKLTIFRSPR